MDTLIHADIFFFVTTIAVVVVASTLTVALVYLAKVLADVRVITRQVKEEAALVREDIAGLRSDIKKEGFQLERLVTFFKALMKIKKFASKRSAARKEK